MVSAIDHFPNWIRDSEREVISYPQLILQKLLGTDINMASI